MMLAVSSLLLAQAMSEGFEGTFPPSGWTLSTGVTQSSTYAHSGTYSASCTPAGQTITTTNKIANPGLVSFWARMSASGGGKVELSYSTDGSTWTSNAHMDFGNITTTFTQYSYTLPVTNVYVRFKPYSYNSGICYLDDLSISPAGPLRYRSRTDGNWSSATTWQVSSDGTNWYNATQSPTSSDDTIEVVSGHTVTVTANVTTDQTTVNGSLTVNSGVTLTIANGTGDDIAINGTLTNTGTVSFNTSATMTAGTSSTIIFNGSAAQTTGSGFPSTVNNLTLNNSYTGSPDLTLSNNLTVNGTFTMTQGTLDLNGKTLSYGTSASLVYDGTAAQNSGSEWLSSMSRPVTISNTSSSGVTMTGDRSTSSSVTVSNGATITMGTYAISGSGSFTLSGGGTFVTANTNGVDGSITTTTYNFSTSGNYTFNGASAQITGNNFPSTVNNFTVENSNGVTWSGPVTVNGNLNVNQGFFEMDDQYFQIPNNSIPIAGFVAVTSTPNLMPTKVDRQWSITGTWTSGNVTCRFYWDDADDDNFDWSTFTPSVYKGTTEYTQTAYDVSGSKNWVEVSIPAADDLSKGTYTIGRSDEGTLPVELSSFTVAMNAYNMVTLMWVTQSETDVSGFRIYRSSEDNLETAEMLNIFVPATNTSQMQVYQVTDEEIFDDGIYYYWLENVDLDGASSLHGPISITVSFTSNTTPTIPVIQGISQAFPNPFNPRLSLVCGMTKAGNASVDIYNARGQHVKTLFTGTQDKGSFTLQWDGTDDLGRKLSSGVYYIKMSSAEQSSIRKVVLSK